jgi:hypothetical protein
MVMIVMMLMLMIVMMLVRSLTPRLTTLSQRFSEVAAPLVSIAPEFFSGLYSHFARGIKLDQL